MINMDSHIFRKAAQNHIAILMSMPRIWEKQ